MASILLLLLALVALLAAAPATVHAHAVLMSASPVDESTVAKPVSKLELTFNEHVVVALGGIKVWGPDGARVDDGDVASEGERVTASIRATARGTYAISYRLISADGHPIRGALTFHVGAPSTSAKSTDAAKAASKSNRGVEAAFASARGIGLLALMGYAGGVIFAVLLAPGARPRVLGWFAIVAFGCVVASFVLDAMNSTGLSVSEALRAEVLRAELGTTWGRAAAVVAGSVFVVAALLRTRDLCAARPVSVALVMGVLALVPIVAWSFGGHAVAGDPAWLRVTLDALHMAAAAVWIGGLIQLVPYLRYDAVTIEHVERYSRVVSIAVPIIVATGLFAAYGEIGLSRAALAETTYGRLVIAKSLLLVGIAPLALLNRRRNVPGLRGIAGMEPNAARRSLRAYVVGELVLIVLVIAATAVLIQTPPARTAIDPGLADVDIRLQSGARAQLVIDPARAGSNEIHVYAATKDDRIDGAVTGMRLKADGPRGIENLDIKLLSAGPGHYAVPARTIPFPGTWTFDVTIERGRFETDAGTATVRIGQGR